MFPAVAESRVLKALGLVFGDIGTSPIYTIGIILLALVPNEDNIFGIISLIFWSLFLIITVQYVWIAMHVGTKGEGGTIVLKEVLTDLLKNSSLVPYISFLAIIGVCLFMGDGVITPAISILSAVEGIRLVPGLEETSGTVLLLIAATIAICLFALQRKGTDSISWAFGPVMAIWFFSLSFTGLVSLVSAPHILFALSPHYALGFLLENGLTSLIVLSAIVLCVTGGEALYADMGHLGREPIVKGWYVVFPALMLSYLGQGAFVLEHGSTGTVLFSMVSSIIGPLYVPFLVLSIGATIIASQAMISGMFSIVYQAMTTRIIPKIKIDYTSSALRSQIYIDTVNWLLLLAVLVVMAAFQSSENLGAAYGLAVAGDMSISAFMLLLIFALKKDPVKAGTLCILLGINLTFFIACLTKLPHGAYWSFLLAFIPFVIIMIFIQGQQKLRSIFRPIPYEEFIEKYHQLYRESCKISGAALYFTSDVRSISPYIGQIFFQNNIIYKQNIMVSVRIKGYPFGVTSDYQEGLAEGLSAFIIEAGYMEIVDIEALLRERGIFEKTIFYGIENIISDRMIWNLFGLMKKASPPFVQFYSLPPEKIHGVVTRFVL
ncbi:KUP/HAK/KT family potassium transporter [Methanospirillum hungatei]|uniref:KUP/HAK/KT family potassium transporter n=1 Tax=Methanospirillum hungatei TaxID=2203 RepID=UPI002BCA5776|nr:KUP/HAK/KT family potassium transporter [Methanospirillum hungatei]HOW03708.1 KUP/HAK/KT family potassium transporter [Methanospirillum hungatei]